MVIGVIGCGKMGSALTQGALKAGVFLEKDTLAFDNKPPSIAALGDEVRVATSMEEVIKGSDILLLCVKPDGVSKVLESISQTSPSSENLLVISIAAGISLSMMEYCVAGKARVIRCMPNTPSFVGEGAAAYALGKEATEEDGAFAQKLLGSVGSAFEIKESMLDAVTGTSGSGPAYVYTFIEALADGALLQGIPRDKALALATQTVLGAAEMVRQSGLHPAELRDRVTSPGGTTIAGLAALEEGSLRSTVIKAVTAATERAKELGS